VKNKDQFYQIHFSQQLPLKHWIGALKIEKIIFNKQYDYVFIAYKDMRQAWPFFHFLPVEIIIEKDSQTYQVYLKNNSHPDYIPWPTEWVKSQAEDKRWKYWEFADFFRDKSNEELVAYSRENRLPIFDWIKKTFTRGIDHHSAIRHINPSFTKNWPDWQWSMWGGNLLPRNWQDDPN
jgi:hypothetical protein